MVTRLFRYIYHKNCYFYLFCNNNNDKNIIFIIELFIIKFLIIILSIFFICTILPYLQYSPYPVFQLHLGSALKYIL